MLSLSVLFLGDANRPEFRAARLGLNRFGAVADFFDADVADAALTDGELAPDAIVVAQTFPGEFSHRAIDRLRRRAPLALVLGLMGSWCEGEMRTGSPWPAVPRNYWHQWPARSARKLGRLIDGKSSSWALPATATEEERVLADAAEPGPTVRGLVVIRSPSLEMAEWLSAACRGPNAVGGDSRRRSERESRVGQAKRSPTEPTPTPTPKYGGTAFRLSHPTPASTIWQRDAAAVVRVEGAAAGIFDGTDLGDAECDELRRFVAALQPAPVIVLLSFPRIEDRDRALSLGAAAVLSKPIAMHDLLWELEQATT